LENFFKNKNISIDNNLWVKYINKGNIDQNKYNNYYKDIPLEFIFENIPNFKKDIDFLDYKFYD
jgi:hypothetical protein